MIALSAPRPVYVTGGTADPRNNLESVYLPAGASGNFTVTVTAANIPGNGVPGNADPTDQDFALVVSNAALSTPAQPGGLAATPGAGSVALDWADVPGSTGYDVFRREAGGAYPPTPTASPVSSDFVDTGRTPGQQYCYVVGAKNEGVAGPLSAEACAVPTGFGGGGPDGSAPVTLDLSSLRSSIRVGLTLS